MLLPPWLPITMRSGEGGDLQQSSPSDPGKLASVGIRRGRGPGDGAASRSASAPSSHRPLPALRPTSSGPAQAGGWTWIEIVLEHEPRSEPAARATPRSTAWLESGVKSTGQRTVRRFSIILPGPAISGPGRLACVGSQEQEAIHAPPQETPEEGPSRRRTLASRARTPKKLRRAASPQWRLIRLHLAASAAAELTSRAAGGGTRRAQERMAVLVPFSTGGILPGASWRAAPPAAEPYTSAQACSTCHQTIHLYGRVGALAVGEQALLPRGAGRASKGHPTRAQSGRGCVWCHAPTALVTGDYDLQRPITRRSLRDLPHRGRRRPEQGRSPVRPQACREARPLSTRCSSPRDRVFGAPPWRAPWCCACHEWHERAAGAGPRRTASGRPASTRSAARPARNATCPSCPATPQRPGLTSTQRRINLHRLVGGSAASRIRAGLVLRIEITEPQRRLGRRAGGRPERRGGPRGASGPRARASFSPSE